MAHPSVRSDTDRDIRVRPRATVGRSDQLNGRAVDWMEKVSDEQYQGEIRKE